MTGWLVGAVERRWLGLEREVSYFNLLVLILRHLLSTQELSKVKQPVDGSTIPQRDINMNINTKTKIKHTTVSHK